MDISVFVYPVRYLPEGKITAALSAQDNFCAHGQRQMHILLHEILFIGRYVHATNAGYCRAH